MDIKSRCQELGITIPALNRPGGLYAPLIRDGDTVYTSGQTARVDGKLAVAGKLGGNVSLEEGRRAARICALNCLAQIDAEYGLDALDRVLKITGFVNSMPDFYNQPKVMDGASELLRDIFGEKGVAARSAIGVSSLPGDSACEVEMIVKMKP